MDSDTNGSSNNRPYAPPSNIGAVLQRLRQRNPPAKIDADFLRDMQISEGTITRALFGLRFLKLIEDDGSLTPTTRSIATSTDEEYQSILAGLVREAYSDVFERLDPTEDTQDKFINFFRRYTPASQRERMVIFFLGMCREAGIPLADAPRQRGSATSSRAPVTRQPAKGKPGPKTKTYRAQNNGVGTETQDTGDAPPALLLLLQSLPPKGTPLSRQKREQWMEMAKAALAFVYPEESDTPSLEKAEDEEVLS